MELKTFLILALFSFTAFSADQTSTSWEKLLETYNLPMNEQSYCYTDGEGPPHGANIDLRIRLASISKLMVSLWALDILGAQYQFKTKLFIKGNNLHISGSVDPFLGNEKMFFLLSQLNDLGYDQFETITFDKYIQVNPNAEIPSDQYPLITRASNARNLKMYFNPNNWPEELQAEYKKVQSSSEGKLRPRIQFKVNETKYSEANPFKNDKEAKVLTLASPKLYKYLKEMNIESNNYVAQTLFLRLGGAAQFKHFLNDSYGKTPDEIYFYTGSGLPDISEGKRQDNYSTCAVTLELIAALKRSIEREGFKLKDIAAVPGSDGGTFNNRPFPSNFKNSWVAKTGTLIHTSTLAGVMNTQKGVSFFGIFNQSTNIEGSKLVQNEMVNLLMSEMDGPLVFDYKPYAFHTYEQNLF